MSDHFAYGHTLQPEEILSDSDDHDDLEDLFNIGANKIEKPLRRHEEESDESNQTVNLKDIQKEKKIEKRKTKKDRKHSKKQKNHKKHRKQRVQSISSDDSSELERKDKMTELENSILYRENYEKYEQIISLPLFHTKNLNETLNSEFTLNQKIGDGYLLFDVIKFPMPELYNYGLMDKDIPRYRRLEGFDSIIGIKQSKLKKYSKIIKELKRVINQNDIKPVPIDKGNFERYFHFEGYQDTGIRIHQKKDTNTDQCLTSFIIFDEYMEEEDKEEVKLMIVNREYNKKLNENPSDIQTWLKFVDIQDSLAQLSNTKKTLQGIYDRKIAILEKALTKNQFNEQLGIHLLTYLREKKMPNEELSNIIYQFIDIHPDSQELWKMYFQAKLGNFKSFSHTNLSKIFENIMNFMKDKISKTTSAIQIWKIRKVSLLILQNIMMIYRMEGYAELSQSIDIALLEYNLFAPKDMKVNIDPQDKLNAFIAYWQHYQNYHLGDVEEPTYWSNTEHINIELINRDKFIGRYEKGVKQLEKEPSNWIETELSVHNIIWRASHSKHDKEVIVNSPESFVFVEDIQHALLIYRDQQNLTLLIDTVINDLGFPPLFESKGIYSSFNYKIVSKMLEKCILDPKSTFPNNDYLFWNHFWNPNKTLEFFSPNDFVKILYLYRILTQIKTVLSQHTSEINSYIFFLITVIYCNPSLQEHFEQTQNTCLEQMQTLLSEESSNSAIWSMYIEISFEKEERSSQECMNCYWQLFQSLQKRVIDPQQLFGLKLNCLFWMSSFDLRHHLGFEKTILKLVLSVMTEENLADIELLTEMQLNSFDILLLMNVLPEKMNGKNTQTMEKTSTSHFKISEQSLIRYFILYFNNSIPNSEIDVEKGALMSRIISKESSLSFEKEFSEWLIINFKLLDSKELIKLSLLKNNPSILLIRYWIGLYRKPVLLFDLYFNESCGHNLALWLTSFLILHCQLAHELNSSNLFEMFFRHSKKIVFESTLSEHPQYLVALNQLLQYNVHHNGNKEFLLYCLDQAPFSKILHLLYIRQCINETERNKMIDLMEEKGIRIYYKNIHGES